MELEAENADLPAFSRCAPEEPPTGAAYAGMAKCYDVHAANGGMPLLRRSPRQRLRQPKERAPEQDNGDEDEDEDEKEEMVVREPFIIGGNNPGTAPSLAAALLPNQTFQFPLTAHLADHQGNKTRASFSLPAFKGRRGGGLRAMLRRASIIRTRTGTSGHAGQDRRGVLTREARCRAFSLG